jgi:hypothetical protein
VTLHEGVRVPVCARTEEFRQVPLARLVFFLVQPPSKQLVPQPQPVRVDHVRLAVVGNLADAPLAVVPLHVGPADAVGLPRHPHHPAEFVQRGPRLQAERRQRVAQVDSVLGVPVEVRPGRQPRRGHPIYHRPVPQDRQVEAVAVERHQLRLQLGDPVDEGGDQLLLSPLAHMGGADGAHRPVATLSVGDEGADAHDRVVDVLRELVAHGLADFLVGKTDEVVRGCKPANVGHRLQVPDDDVPVRAHSA